jgi:hypothetical protein
MLPAPAYTAEPAAVSDVPIPMTAAAVSMPSAVDGAAMSALPVLGHAGTPADLPAVRNTPQPDMPAPTTAAAVSMPCAVDSAMMSVLPTFDLEVYMHGPEEGPRDELLVQAHILQHSLPTTHPQLWASIQPTCCSRTLMIRLSLISCIPWSPPCAPSGVRKPLGSLPRGMSYSSAR